MDDEDNEYLMNARNQVVKKHDFEEKEKTSEYMETHYYKQTNITQFASLIERNQFWCDLAKHYATSNHGNFLTSSFTATAVNDRESLLAVCFLDLV